MMFASTVPKEALALPYEAVALPDPTTSAVPLNVSRVVRAIPVTVFLRVMAVLIAANRTRCVTFATFLFMSYLSSLGI
jgi:hypothetical protein